MADQTLIFAYDALMDPETLSALAPNAEFLFVAHYPETRLGFVAGTSDVPTPTLVKDPGNIVWGAVFTVPSADAESVVEWANQHGRSPGLTDQKAVDREGNKHDCLVLVTPADSETRPDPAYISSMVRGARHWNLPAGWIMGLDDLTAD